MSSKVRAHVEAHRTSRVGWLRAAVLGANDGAVSVASVVIGVAASDAGPRSVIIAGTAAMVAGAVSMAAGEYVSVKSQSDTERADLAMEAAELESNPEGERAELAAIYESRGLSPELAGEVADALTQHDALGAHARDELGLSDVLSARPTQAAVASAVAFAIGAILPVAVAAIAPADAVVPAVGGVTVLTLCLLGGLAARVGGASVVRGAIRVVTWGLAAMLLTAAVGTLFGVSAG